MELWSSAKHTFQKFMPFENQTHRRPRGISALLSLLGRGRMAASEIEGPRSGADLANTRRRLRAPHKPSPQAPEIPSAGSIARIPQPQEIDTRGITPSQMGARPGVLDAVNARHWRKSGFQARLTQSSVLEWALSPQGFAGPFGSVENREWRSLLRCDRMAPTLPNPRADRPPLRLFLKFWGPCRVFPSLSPPGPISTSSGANAANADIFGHERRTRVRDVLFLWEHAAHNVPFGP